MVSCGWSIVSNSKMKRWIVAALLLMAACKKEYPQAAARLAYGLPVRGVAESRIGKAAAPPPAPAAARMIIRNATMSLVVADAVDVLRKASALVESRGGYVAEERQWKERDQVRVSATLRVPAQQLAPALDAIRRLAVRVDSESITGQDVSQEFTDLGAQLKNLQATEAELRELLTTVRQRTQKAADIMEVYSELTKVRGEIETMQGRMQYLSQMTALSTISLDLVPDALAAPVVEPGWQPVATVKSAARALVNTLKSLADAAIWVTLYFLPIAVLFVLFALVIRAVWKAAASRRTSS